MIERPIHKEIKDFKEKIVMGLTARQLACTILALIIGIPTYLYCSKYFSEDTTSWICIIAVIPPVLIGFYKKNGLTFEQYAMVWFRFNLLVPQKRKYKSSNFFEDLINSDSTARKRKDVRKTTINKTTKKK